MNNISQKEKTKQKMETNVRKIRKKTNQPKEGSYKREKEKK